MREQEQNEKSMTTAREWFKTHQATAQTFLIGDSAGEIIDWRRPDTSSYAVRFTIMGRYVIVTGDLGEAIYAWGQELDREKLASFDWHYFVNKCVASETGRNYTMKIPGIKHPVPNVRAIGHFIGLQMAIKQLENPMQVVETV